MLLSRNVARPCAVNLLKQLNMKLVTTLSFTIMTIISLVSCSNHATYQNDHLNPTILGKWNIVTDSGFSGVGSGNHPVNYSDNPAIILISGQMAISI